MLTSTQSTLSWSFGMSKGFQRIWFGLGGWSSQLVVRRGWESAAKGWCFTEGRILREN
jgi:hypothetical protein